MHHTTNTAVAGKQRIKKWEGARHPCQMRGSRHQVCYKSIGENKEEKKKKATNEFLADPHIFLDSEDSPKVQD